MRKHYALVSAIIVAKGQILCTKRGDNKYPYIANKWEFPGGKIEDDELPGDAIVREIKEELKLDIKSPKYYSTVHHQYPDFDITLYTFVCEVMPNCHFELVVHTESRWLSPIELPQLDWLEGDKPVVRDLTGGYYDFCRE